MRGISTDSLLGFGEMKTGSLLNNLPPEKHLAWTQRQTYFAMGFLLEAAALLRIDATSMERFEPAA